MNAQETSVTLRRERTHGLVLGFISNQTILESMKNIFFSMLADGCTDVKNICGVTLIWRGACVRSLLKRTTSCSLIHGIVSVSCFQNPPVIKSKVLYPSQLNLERVEEQDALVSCLLFLVQGLLRLSIIQIGPADSGTELLEKITDACTQTECIWQGRDSFSRATLTRLSRCCIYL